MEVCYRHPNRETGVSCSNCGRPICPECMTATPVGMRCPECARQRTKVRTAQTLTDEPRLTYILIGVNVLVFLGVFLGGGASFEEFELSRSGVEAGDYWILITGGFLHYQLFHLFLNMFALWILGGLLEPVVGAVRFGVIYFVSLLTGAFGALLLTPDGDTVGASGAIYGLLGAAIVVMRRRGMNLMESGLALWLGLNLLITFALPGISIGGHLGGLAGGLVTALVLFELGERIRLPPVVPTAVCVVLGAVAIAASVAISGS